MPLILVTGGSGHLGIAVCRKLLEENYSVRTFQRHSTKALEKLGVEQRKGEITDAAFLRDSMRGVDAVIHCAAKISIDGDPDGEVKRTNVHGTECVIAACQELNIPRLVHISSVHAYDMLKVDRLTADDKLVGTYGKAFAYDSSKREGLLRVKEAAAKGLNAVILCPVGLLGPYDHMPSLMGGFFRNFYKGRLPSLVKGAFFWADTRDTAAAAVNAIKHGHKGQVYLLGGHYASVGTLAKIVGLACKKSLWRPQLPVFIALIGLPVLRVLAWMTGTPPLYTYESLSVLRYHPKSIDDSKARKELGYKLRPLQETVTDACNWLQQEDSSG